MLYVHTYRTPIEHLHMYDHLIMYIRILNLSVKEQKQRQADRTANLLSLRITHTHTHVCNVCMYCTAACSYTTHLSRSLSLHQPLRIFVVVALCALYACVMRIY